MWLKLCCDFLDVTLYYFIIHYIVFSVETLLHLPIYLCKGKFHLIITIKIIILENLILRKTVFLVHHMMEFVGSPELN